MLCKWMPLKCTKLGSIPLRMTHRVSCLSNWWTGQYFRKSSTSPPTSISRGNNNLATSFMGSLILWLKALGPWHAYCVISFWISPERQCRSIIANKQISKWHQCYMLLEASLSLKKSSWLWDLITEGNTMITRIYNSFMLGSVAGWEKKPHLSYSTPTVDRQENIRSHLTLAKHLWSTSFLCSIYFTTSPPRALGPQKSINGHKSPFPFWL